MWNLAFKLVQCWGARWGRYGLINCGRLLNPMLTFCQREPSVILNAKGGYWQGVPYIYICVSNRLNRSKGRNASCACRMPLKTGICQFGLCCSRSFLAVLPRFATPHHGSGARNWQLFNSLGSGALNWSPPAHCDFVCTRGKRQPNNYIIYI